MNDPAPEMSGPLAERYCDFLDALDEIDLAAVERRIERLIRLRDALRKLRGDGARTVVTPPVLVASVPEPEPARRRPMGFWPEFVKQCLSDGPRSALEMLDALTTKSASDHTSLLGTLRRYGRMFRPLETDPPTWELIPKAEADLRDAS